MTCDDCTGINREKYEFFTHLTHSPIFDAIITWRDGGTFDAVHPLADGHATLDLFDDNAVKDLARVISHSLRNDEIPRKELPWGNS